MNYILREFKHPNGKIFEEIFFTDNDTANFLIEWGQIEGHFVSFIIHEVTSWIDDNMPLDYEKYLSGTVKWDGCSHVNFGENDGYLHLCGKYYWDQHCLLIQTIWDICSKKIKDFNPEIAS